MNASQSSTWYFTKPEQRVQLSYNRWFNTNIKKRIRYDFVRKDWDRDITGMISVDRLQDEPHDPVYVPLDDDNRAVLVVIKQAGIDTLMQFLDYVATQEKAELFCSDWHIKPTNLQNLLRKIFKFLPAGAQIRQLVNKDDALTHSYIDQLVKHKLGFSMAFLEIVRKPLGRRELAERTGIPDDALLDLARRADMTRLGLMGGGMVRTSWALGYKGLAAFTDATPEEYFARCVDYYNKIGKGIPFDFTVKNVVSHVKRMQDAKSIIEE